MAEYISSQSGDWSDPATWGGAGVPSAGDTAKFGGHWHEITVTGTHSIGDGGTAITSAPYAFCQLIIDGGTLDISGSVDITYCALIAKVNSTINLNNTIVTGDNTDSNNVFGSDTTRQGIHFEGTALNPVTINGTGNCQFDTPTSFFAKYTVFNNVNNTSDNKLHNPNIQNRSVEAGFVFDYCVFDGCGSLNYKYLHNNYQYRYEITNCYFVNGKDDVYFESGDYYSTQPANYEGSPYSRIISNCYFDGVPASSIRFSCVGVDWIVRDCLLHNILTYGNHANNITEAGVWENNFFYQTHVADPYILVGHQQFTGNVQLINTDKENPHFLQTVNSNNLDYLTNPDFYLSDCYFEYNGQASDGDVIKVDHCNTSDGSELRYQAFITNNWFGANADRGNIGCSFLWNSNFPQSKPTITFNKNTCFVGGSNGCVNISETGDNFYNAFDSFMYNVFWNEDEGRSDAAKGHKLQDIGDNAEHVDHVLPVVCDYNGGWNLKDGSNFNGYHQLEVSDQNYTQIFGLHDINGSPAFVDMFVRHSKWVADYIGDAQVNTLLGHSYDPRRLSEGGTLTAAEQVTQHTTLSQYGYEQQRRHYDFRDTTADSYWVLDSYKNYIKAGMVIRNPEYNLNGEDLGFVAIAPDEAYRELIETPTLTYNDYVTMDRDNNVTRWYSSNDTFSYSGAYLFSYDHSNGDCLYIGRNTIYSKDARPADETTTYGIGTFHNIKFILDSTFTTPPNDVRLEYYSFKESAWLEVPNWHYDNFLTGSESNIYFEPPSDWGVYKLEGFGTTDVDKWKWWLRFRLEDKTGMAGYPRASSITCGNNTFTIKQDKANQKGEVNLYNLLQNDNDVSGYKVVDSFDDFMFINASVFMPTGVTLEANDVTAVVHRQIEVGDRGKLKIGSITDTGIVTGTASVFQSGYGSYFFDFDKKRLQGWAGIPNLNIYGSKFTMGQDQNHYGNVYIKDSIIDLTSKRASYFGYNDITLNNISVTGGGYLPITRKGTYDGIKLFDGTGLYVQPGNFGIRFDLKGISGTYDVEFLSQVPDDPTYNALPPEEVRTNVNFVDSDIYTNLTIQQETDSYIQHSYTFTATTVDENQQSIEETYAIATRDDGSFLAVDQAFSILGSNGVQDSLMIKAYELQTLLFSLRNGHVTVEESQKEYTFNPYNIKVFAFGYLPYVAQAFVETKITTTQTMIADALCDDDVETAKSHPIAITYSEGAFTDPDLNTYSFQVDCGGASLHQAYKWFNYWFTRPKLYKAKCQSVLSNAIHPTIGEDIEIQEHLGRVWKGKITNIEYTEGSAWPDVTFFIKSSLHEDDLDFVWSYDNGEAYIDQELYMGTSTVRWLMYNPFVFEDLPTGIHEARKAVPRPLLQREGVSYDGQKGFTFTNFNGNLLTTISDDGTKYTAPIQTEFTLTGLKPGSEVRVYKTSDLSEVTGTESSGETFSYFYDSTGEDVFYVIHHVGYVSIRQEFILDSNNRTIPVQQQLDRVYNNPL